MKTFLFIIAVLTGPCIVSQIVNIPDTNFKSALIGLGVDTNGDGEIQAGEASNFTNPLLVGANNISDMTGIEAFVNITELQCGGNQITQLDLSSNSFLEVVRCANNQLTSLILGANSNMKRIDLFANPIASIDLSELPNLEYFEGLSTSFTSLDTSENPNLEFLNLTNSPIATLNVVNNPNLKLLNCRQTNISSIDVSNNPLLEFLFVSNTSVSTVDLTNNPELKLLGISNLGLTSLDLSNNTALEFIDMRNNNISDIDFSIFPDLKGLRVRDNLISSLDMSSNTSLCHLLADSDALQYINLKNGNNNLLIPPGPCAVEISVGTGYFSFNPIFTATFSDNLEIICVDDVLFAQLNFLDIPPGAVFTENCELSTESNDLAMVQLFPNPARDRVTIASDSPISSLVVRNTLGQNIASLTAHSSQVSLDIEAFASGLYFVEVNTGFGKRVHQLIKE